MSKAAAIPGQGLVDIAVQHLGSAEAAYSLAVLNGLDVTAELSAGQVLDLPEVENKRVARIMKERRYTPASGPVQESLPAPAISWIRVASQQAAIPGNVAAVQPGQGMADIAVQYLGSAEAAYSLAALNGLDVTAELAPGQILQLPEEAEAGIVKDMQANGWAPASGLEYFLEGIEIWGIEVDFVVS